MITTPPDDSAPETPMHALSAMRRARRRKRIEEVDWLDAMYRVYVTAIVGIVVVLFISSFVGDNELTTSELADVRAHGPAAIGLLAALAIAGGLRSGARGGPLALEPAEVRHVLLAPIERGSALRSPVLKQLRFGIFVGAVVGAIAGQLAVRRMPGAPLAWVASGGTAGATVAALFIATALCAAGWQLRQAWATVVGAAFITWAALDLAEVVPAPTTTVGTLALWPLRVEPIDLLAVVVALGLLILGMRAIGGISVEAAERRTGLVGQLRFAVTVQDLRTVIVLRRQLAQDRPRMRPWIQLRRVGRRLPVWRRDWLGIFRFPAARLARLALLGIAAGLCVRATWAGTTPLFVVAALALFVAAIDAFEPLAQQVDQADLSDALPVSTGSLLERHLPSGIIVMLVVTIIAGLAGAVVQPSSTAFAIAGVMVMPAAFAAAAGGVASIVMGAPSPAPEGEQLMPPEVAGMRIALRAAWPVLLALLGVAPILLARYAYEEGGPPVAVAAACGVVALIAGALTAVWVRRREDLHRWWNNLIEQTQAQTRGTTA